MLPLQRLPATMLGAALFALSSQAAHKQCYWTDGIKAGDDMQPCNPDAKVSACCAINKARPDICTSYGGLCLAQDDGYTGMMYANGCTDPTGNNRNCPQICRGKGDASNYNVLQCNAGGAYCCRAAKDATNCCDNKTLQVSGDLGTFQFATTLSTSSGTSSDTSNANGACPRDNTAVVGGAVGGVLGAALLVALGTITFLCRRRSKGFQQASQYSAVGGKGSYGATQHSPQELPGETAHEMRG